MSRIIVQVCTKLYKLCYCNDVVVWYLGSVQHWDEILPNGYKTSGLKSPASRASKRPMWDGSFPKQRHNVAKELEAGCVGYGATGELLVAFFYPVLVFKVLRLSLKPG